MGTMTIGSLVPGDQISKSLIDSGVDGVVLRLLPFPDRIKERQELPMSQFLGLRQRGMGAAVQSQLRIVFQNHEGR